MANGNQDFSPQAIQQRMIAQASPLFRQGAQAVRQAAAGAGRRRGVFGAADISRQATEALAPALGQTALKAGQVGEQLGAEFEKQRRALELQREQLAQQKELEQARLAEMVRQRQQQAQMQLLQHTGFTPQLLESAGLMGEGGEPFGGRGAFRGFQRDIGRLGLPGFPFSAQGGFGRPGGFGLTSLGAGSNLRLQMMFPGMSRAGRLAMAQRMGLFGGGGGF